MELYHAKGMPQTGGFELALDYSEMEGIAKNGLLELSIMLGFKALEIMLADEVTSLVGEKGKHNNERNAYRHGKEKTSVVLGGQKVPIERPRVRSVAGNAELPITTLDDFQKECILNNTALQRIMSGVSVRDYSNTLDSVPEKSFATSKSTVSRRFIKETEALMKEFFSRQLTDYYPVIMMDGVAVGKYLVIVVLGITSGGKKHILGLAEGTSENATVCSTLLRTLIGRGLDAELNRLFVLDGGKGLKKAVEMTFGKSVQIQRCQIHKLRNVLSHLPKKEQPEAKGELHRAYMEFGYSEAKRKLEQLAKRLEYKYPSAAKSLLEGMEETLTVHRLKIPGLLRQSISNTNPIESAIGITMEKVDNVKHWQNGNQALRWLGVGFKEAESKFRTIKGYRQLPFLINAVNPATSSEVALSS